MKNSRFARVVSPVGARPIASAGCLILGALLASVAIAAADPPGLVNYQGVLRDATEAPVTASLDMLFRLFDAASGGSEILVDRHQAALTGDVAVSGGLFNVTLGGGTVEDGSGTGTYTTLAEAFRDFAEVYLEVEIETPMGFETLAPRTRIVSAPYALSARRAASAADADHAASADQAAGADHAASADQAGTADQAGNAGLLDGIDSSAFLRSDASDTFTTGTLTLGPGTLLKAQGLVDVESLRATDSLYALGGFRVGSAPAVGASYSHFGGFGFFPNSGAITTSLDVWVEGNVELGGTLYLNGQLRLDDNGPDHDQFLYFYEGGSPTGVSIAWDDSADLFLVNETVRALSLETVADAISINADGPDSLQSLYFYEDNSATGERLQWDNTNDRFYLSDDLWVAGALDVQTNLNVAGAKNFVQNHPSRRDLSVVYTALEGDEAGTFTRGFGRLVGGKARIALGETFALVTNPDVGLTAHLTPRGEWATLYVESLSTSELVVRAAPGSPDDAMFDFVVFGLRIGYEAASALRPRQMDSRVPHVEQFEELYSAYPELRASSALERYRGMGEAAGIVVSDETPASVALRRGIGEYDTGGATPAEDADGAHGDGLRGPSEAGAGRPNGEPHGSRQRGGSAATAVGDAVPGAEPTRLRPDVPSRRAELAITLPVAGPVEAGDVLVVDEEGMGPLRLAERASDPAVAGVVAEAPAFSEANGGKETTEAEIVVAGVVACKVDAALGEIRSGDLLTTSPTPGHAMRAAEALPGTIVGKALEPLAVGTGKIRVLVMPR